LYDLRDFYHFLTVLDAAAAVLLTPADFSRVVYESLEDGVRTGNLRYREMFFNPTTHAALGVSYATVLEGLSDGIRAAERDFGVVCRLIPSIDRRGSAALATAMVDEVIAHACTEVIGIGMDYAERDGPPQRFVTAYQRAGQAGLRRTAHVCEDNQTLAEAPPANVAACLDELGCDRLDHGYNILADPALVARCRAEGVYFNVCSHTSNFARIPTRRATIGRMLAEGLRLTLNTDDPAMFGTNVGDAYVSLFGDLRLGADVARQFSLNGVDASWLDTPAKRSLRLEFERELDTLLAELDSPTPLGAPS
jgi:adenosine deaminase